MSKDQRAISELEDHSIPVDDIANNPLAQKAIRVIMERLSYMQNILKKDQEPKFNVTGNIPIGVFKNLK